MVVRQRQRIGTNRYQDDKADENDNNNALLDEDEQEALIQQLQKDYIQQSERLEKIFTILCRFIVPMISFIYTLLLEHWYNDSYHHDNKSMQGSHDDTLPYNNRHHNVISLRYIHLILNVIIHWYIPKGILRKPNLSPSETIRTTSKPKASSITIESEKTVSLTVWYGVYLPYFLTLLITAIAHWMIRHQRPQLLNMRIMKSTAEDALFNYYHFTLCASATIFLLSAWYIQEDHHEYIDRTINDLKLHKYQYKSL